MEDLGLAEVTLKELREAAEIACHPDSDIHRLPFKVVPEQLMAAMVSTTCPVETVRQNLGINSEVESEILSK